MSSGCCLFFWRDDCVWNRIVTDGCVSGQHMTMSWHIWQVWHNIVCNAMTTEQIGHDVRHYYRALLKAIYLSNTTFYLFGRTFVRMDDKLISHYSHESTITIKLNREKKGLELILSKILPCWRQKIQFVGKNTNATKSHPEMCLASRMLYEVDDIELTERIWNHALNYSHRETLKHWS